MIETMVTRLECERKAICQEARQLRSEGFAKLPSFQLEEEKTVKDKKGCFWIKPPALNVELEVRACSSVQVNL